MAEHIPPSLCSTHAQITYCDVHILYIVLVLCFRSPHCAAMLNHHQRLFYNFRKNSAEPHTHRLYKELFITIQSQAGILNGPVFKWFLMTPPPSSDA